MGAFPSLASLLEHGPGVSLEFRRLMPAEENPFKSAGTAVDSPQASFSDTDQSKIPEHQRH